jgi:hypothetical protein
MAYPQTSVNTIATAPEMMKMQLRVYLGAYLKNPANVMVLPDVHFEGIIEGGGVNADGNFWHFFGKNEESENASASLNSRSLDFTAMGTEASKAAGDLATSDKNPLASTDGRIDTIDDTRRLLTDPKTAPLVLYQGAVFGDAVGHELLEPNEGHLGALDCPAGMNKVFGLNVFTPGAPAVNPH